MHKDNVLLTIVDAHLPYLSIANSAKAASIAASTASIQQQQ